MSSGGAGRNLQFGNKAPHIDRADRNPCEGGRSLAAELDRRAVVQNEPTLRSLADCVRLLCLPTPRHRTDFENYRRVGKALVHGFHAIARHAEEQLCCDLERFVFGWAALPACTDMLSRGVSAAPNAVYLGRSMAVHRIVAAASAARRKERKRMEEAEDAGEEAAEGAVQVPAAGEAVPDHHLVVVRLSSEAMKNTKLKDTDALVAAEELMAAGVLRRIVDSA